MKIKINTLDKPDKDWDRRVLEVGKNIYQTTTYAEIQEKCLNTEIEYLVAYQGSKIVGQLIVFYSPRFAKYLNKGNMKTFKFFSKHFKTYTFIEGPIIFDETLKKEIYSSFLDYLDSNKQNCYMAKDLVLPIKEDKEIYKLFYDRGFFSDKWGTVLIDVQLSLDVLWKNIGKKRRNLVRKGEKSGLVMEEVNTKKNYEKVVAIIKEKSKRNNVFHYNKKYYDNFFKILQYNGIGKVWVAKKDGIILSTITTYLFGKNVCQTDVAHSDYCIKNKIPATDFLEWKIIKFANENGYNTYDLSGIRPKSKEEKHMSMKHYKTTWGGEEIHFPYFSKTYSKSKQFILNLLNFSKNWLVRTSSN